jgi:tRNA A-37 threonylcarbamoyl transferase component Bud32
MKNHWESVLRVMKGIASGLRYVHSRRICHGDLNPSNVLLKVRTPCGAFQNDLARARRVHAAQAPSRMIPLAHCA